MSTDNDSSSSWIDTGFIDRYLDYLEGETTEPRQALSVVATEFSVDAEC